VALFGRREKAANDDDSPNTDSDAPASAAEAPADVPKEEPRTQGPWDESDAYPDVPRVDLGGVLIPQSEAFRIQVQADQSTGAVSQLSLVTDTSAVQLQPYAAPRSGGMWSDVRSQISSQINQSGGLVEESTGPFGVELRAQVKNQEGQLQPARFCGIDGPRWFVRLVFLGQAARDPQIAQPLEEAIRQVVVVRGDTAMPMGNALPMRVPTDTPASPAAPVAPAAPDRPTLSLPERGPEITETR
jgi:hypothetical protein